MPVVDPGCVKTHTSAKCRKYNSLIWHQAVCAQYDLTLPMRNRFAIFLRARQALEFLHSLDPSRTWQLLRRGGSGYPDRLRQQNETPSHLCSVGAALRFAGVGFFMLLPVISLMSGGGTGLGASKFIAFVVSLPVTYMLGIVPALLVCGADAALAANNFTARSRIWSCAGLGFLMGFLPLLTSMSAGFIHGPWVLMFGAVGAIPGAACSWLSELRKSENA
jgi:hypothetical protein